MQYIKQCIERNFIVADDTELPEEADGTLIFHMLRTQLPELAVFYETDHLLTGRHYTFFQDSEKILCQSEEKINALADLLDDLGCTAITGYYDPEEDERNGTVDQYTGFYYLDI